MNKLMDELLQQEKENMFPYMNATLAYSLGNVIVQKAIKENLQLCVDIHAYNKTLFRFLSDKCLPDNEKWLERKRNTVLYFHHSSYFMQEKINKDNHLITHKYGLSQKDYAFVGGSFPIIIEKCGTVGAITISGLLPEEDHALIMQAIQEIKQKNGLQ